MNLNTYTAIPWYIFSFLFSLTFNQEIKAQCVPSSNNQLTVSLDFIDNTIKDPFTIIEENLNSTCVNDNIAPIAICDEHTKVSLTSDGTASVDAINFDDGSYDNCDIIDFKVRRMATLCAPQTSFENHVIFDCCDVNSGYIMVELKVIDAAGNSNSCMIEVDVEDKINPIISCPSNKTIECSQNLFNFGLLGQPTVSDNCPGVTIQRVDNNNLNDCGLGTVTRIWTAVDVNGRTSSCVQIITIINSYPFDENDIIYPFDLTTTECDVSSLSPDNLSHPYSKPTLNDDACDQVAVNYEDTYLPIAAPACFKILRKWTVIDWCQFDLNAIPNQNGYVPGKWQHTQIIKVLDYTPPIFVSCPNDVTIESFESDCGNTFVELITQAEDCSPDLSYTYEIDLFNDGSMDHTGISNNASGEYPLGNHKIYYTTSDGCGNLGFCSFFFNIKDGKKPTPICNDGLATDLNENGSVTIWASDFDSGSSFDNCTGNNNLTFSFSSDQNETSLVFDCSTLGEQPIQLWVTDEGGNQDFCTTYVDIQDNVGACPAVLLASISGNIQTEDGTKIENATLLLQENLSTPYYSTIDGNYSFDDLPQGFSYTVFAEKNTTPLNGVTTLDLVLISKHILGIEFLSSPYKMIAADVNDSGTITTMDIVQVRRLILNMDSEFQNNTSWQFVDASYTFNNPTNPFSEDVPEKITITNLTQNTVANFIAIKTGDVNNSASPNDFTTGDTREKTGNLFFHTENKNFKKGELVEVKFSSKNFINIIGYQFSIEFNPSRLELIEINPILENLSKNNINTKFAKTGIITTSWHQTDGYHQNQVEVFSLTFKALADGKLDNILSINSAKTKAEAYYINNNPLNVKLNFVNPTNNLQSSDIKLFQNKPNPFETQTTIAFNIPNNENVDFEISDINGRIVKKISEGFQKGYNEVIFQKEEFNSYGVLFYSLNIDGKRLTKTMMVKD